MPLYVYVCTACGNRVEKLRTFAERLEPASCPDCGAQARFALSLSAPSLVGSVAAGACEGPGPDGCCGAGACGMN